VTTADPLQTEPPLVLVDDPDGYMESQGHIQVCDAAPTPEAAVAYCDENFPRGDIDEDTIHFCDGNTAWMKRRTDNPDDDESWEECAEGDDGAVKFWVIVIGCANG
jgi:hypothetical protein